jgi:hypothetical protein
MRTFYAVSAALIAGVLWSMSTAEWAAELRRPRAPPKG